MEKVAEALLVLLIPLLFLLVLFKLLKRRR